MEAATQDALDAGTREYLQAARPTRPGLTFEKAQAEFMSTPEGQEILRRGEQEYRVGAYAKATAAASAGFDREGIAKLRGAAAVQASGLAHDVSKEQSEFAAVALTSAEEASFDLCRQVLAAAGIDTASLLDDDTLQVILTAARRDHGDSFSARASAFVILAAQTARAKATA